MTLHRTAALVLAGGAAQRMGGGDKPLLTVGGRTMLAAVIAALDVPHVAISANGDPARFDAFGLPVLSDGAFLGQGPLAGVLAGLEWAAAMAMTALLTAPGDTPFLPRGLAEWLAPPPCCVCNAGQKHHLVGLWPVDRAPLLRTLLSEAGPRSVAHFAALIGMRYAEYAIPAVDPFANVNTPGDLAQVRKIALNDGDGAGVAGKG